MTWKPLKWWLLCLIALVFAFWLSGTPAAALLSQYSASVSQPQLPTPLDRLDTQLEH
ncbi:MAG: hypothetical protein AAFQ63_13795 [Cyanobacteria bacterium J06621_11]